MKPWEAVVIVLLIVGAAGYLGYITIPGLTPGSGVQTSTHSSATGGGAAGSLCNANSIQSTLTTYNSQSISLGKVFVYQQSGNGQYSQIPSATTTQTLNTINAASVPSTPPWVTVWNASAAYPTTISVAGTVGSSSIALANLGSGSGGNSVICSANAAASNNVPTYQQTGFLYLGPASGTSATTNVESVVNSQISQTNSFPAAFPTAAPQTETVYLQLFANSIVAMKGVAIPGSTNSPITDYGGVTCNGVSEQATSSIVTSALVCYQGYAIFAFNQTAISFSAPGAVPITVHGQSGEVAWAVPVTSCGPAPTSGTATTNPFVGCQVTFSVQETIAATSHHIDMYVGWADETQLGYIQQYFSGPAVTSFLAAGNAAGLGTGFAGIVPPTVSNAPHPIVEQHSSVIATY